MDRMWTNSTKLGDFFQTGLLEQRPSVSEVYIAVAFFTDEKIIEELLSRGCRIRMIVRLGYPTSVPALRKLLSNQEIQLRFYTSTSFHPKLYIFGSEVAMLGSANLTNSAVMANQEIVVAIESEDPRFDDLVSLFSDYWDESEVLTPDVLNNYDSILKKHRSSMNNILESSREIQKKLGDVTFSNIDRKHAKKPKEQIFLNEYRKIYQESVAAFNKIKKVYVSVGKRKDKTDSVPIRIEIDAFISFVRKTYAFGEKWTEQPIGWNQEKEGLLLTHIYEWMESDWPYFTTDICKKNYPLIKQVFESPEKINNSEYDEIMDALAVLHSLHDRQRYFPGGLPKLIDTFKDSNEIHKVKKSLTYLLFGENEVTQRMADLLFDSSYKLSEFGKSNVQELIGWINKEELPVMNSRTTKVLRFYGFDVKQVYNKK